MKNLLIKESMKLEGRRFMIFKEMDKAKYDYWKYPTLQRELNEINIRLEQYRKIINEFSGTKRKMLR